MVQDLLQDASIIIRLSDSLNPVKGGLYRGLKRATIGVVKGDSRSLDYSSSIGVDTLTLTPVSTILTSINILLFTMANTIIMTIILVITAPIMQALY